MSTAHTHTLRFKITVALILVITQLLNVSQASTDIELINQLNDSMKELTDAVEKIQDLNPDEQVLSGFFQTMQQSPNKDNLKASGENINYPAVLKAEYDNAITAIFLTANKIFTKVNSGSGNNACKNKMQNIEIKFDKLEPLLVESQQLSVGYPEPRAKAYISLIQAMPLGLIVAEISMAKMSTCSSF